MTKQNRRAWLIGGTVFVSLFFLWGGCIQTSPVFFAALLKSFNWSHARTSSISGVLSLSIGVTVPFTGWLIDRVGARIVMSAGATLAGLALIGASCSNTFGELITANVVLGVGVGASSIVPSTVVIANWFDERRGTALGLTTLGIEFGGTILTMVIGYVIATSGWRTGYLALALPLLILVLPLMILIIRTRPKGAVEHAVSRSEPVLKAAAGEEVTGLEIRDALSTQAFWMLVVAYFAHGFIGLGILLHLIVYLVGLGYSHRIATLVVSAILGLAALGKPVTGILGDYLGGKNALALCYLSQAAGSSVLLVANQVWVVALFVALWALPGASMHILVPLAATEALGLRRLGTIFGWLSLCVSLGMFVGPVMVGWTFDLTGSYTSGIALCTVAALIAAAASFLCVAPKPAKIKPIVQVGTVVD